MKGIKNKKVFFISLYILLSVLALLMVWIIYGNTHITVTQINIESEKIPESFYGFRIVQISDLHNAEFGKDNERLLSEIENANPDIIVVTGDVVDSRHTDIDVAASFMNNAAKIAPLYYVHGNHEVRMPDEYAELLGKTENENIHVLTDETVMFEKGDEKITLIGMQDYIVDSAAIYRSLKPICDETEGYKIVLSHKPDFFDYYVKCGADLVFCGHAHGGQLILPFVGGVFAPGQGWFPEYTEGVYTKDETSMIVSRGLGNSIFPFRINNCPEIVVAELSGEN